MKAAKAAKKSDAGPSPFALPGYAPTTLEPAVLQFWNKHKTYPSLKKKLSKGHDAFYFLDGPPYTSGKVHLGTAWNKSLKDAVLRYKRMQGFNVWDRAGYDMHGLPTEHATEKKLGIKGKQGIEKIGVKKFIAECAKLCVENMHVMNQDFIRLGAWMDFKNPYQSITKEYIEGVWWLVKKAHDAGRLYEGKRSMTWCSTCATAVAKHELEYKTLTDPSLFIKFPIVGTEKKFLIIWTTTPWTIPFNLAVMVNPDFEYVTVKILDGKEQGEQWVLAKNLAAPVLGMVANRKYKIVEEYAGEKLEGTKYVHPFLKDIPFFSEFEHPKLHTVLLGSEYVALDAGSGLVHCAPGCGAEDYEVGHLNGLPAFNHITEQAVFENMGRFNGLIAKKDDAVFVDAIEKTGLLVAAGNIDHEYPQCERCHTSVVYRSTKQWFFKVEDLKEKMIAENKKIKWVPESAFNAFNSWLTHLRDNSITKQRYWGTPVPIWRCDDCENYLVIETVKELEKHAKKKVKELHKPDIDLVTIKCPCGGTKKRIPDILDVWVDAGCAAWNCIDFPASKKNFSLFPAEFILEGKDQIRGWFNLLMVSSMIAFGKPSFKACYMHGFVQDALGRKMSKSLGNVISPAEVVDQYGADTFRYYTIGSCPPATDLKYNFDDIKLKYKNLIVLWNLHKYIIDLSTTADIAPQDISEKRIRAVFSVEEKYMLSKLHAAIKKATDAFDGYLLNEVPWIVEDLFLELSRTYIQLVRDKSSVGTDTEKQAVLLVLSDTLRVCLKLFAPIAPFVSEALYQNLRTAFGAAWSKEESIHHTAWPVYDKKLIDSALEEQVTTAKTIIQSILAAREKASLGVRWPVAAVSVVSSQQTVRDAGAALHSLIKTHTNVKIVSFSDHLQGVKLKVKGDYKKLGPAFGNKAAEIIAKLSIDSPETVLSHIEKEGKHRIKVGSEEIAITRDQITIERELPAHLIAAEFRGGTLYLDTRRTPELDAEGFARELTRRIQALRKNAGLEKRDTITIFVKTTEEMARGLGPWSKQLAEKIGASSIKISAHEPNNDHAHKSVEKIKDVTFEVGFDRV
ncbi:MAG: isoleucine--tRNA ligase [Candidatus Woesearchaeota archaeon]|nr:isoleucine--tRNA ligase [Candidatus Woesearchaeota archaeon]